MLVSSTSEACRLSPADKVDAKDTVGAGDAFLGSLGAYLARGLTLEAAVEKAVRSGKGLPQAPLVQSVGIYYAKGGGGVRSFASLDMTFKSFLRPRILIRHISYSNRASLSNVGVVIL